MFNLKWAYKNLCASRRRTFGMIIFNTVIFTIMIINLLFLDGTNTQMKAALRNNKGDLYFWSANGLTTVDYSLDWYKQKVENKIRFLSKFSQAYGSSGYAEGWVLGTEPAFLKFLDRNVSWPAKYRENLKEGTALVENGLAQKLNVTRGDFITIKIKTDTGMVNTLQVMVDGIFVGSNLLYGDVVYINIKDQNLLWMTGHDTDCNEIKLYFKRNVSDDDLQTIQKVLTSTFPEVYITCPKLNPTSDPVFTTFNYYRYMLLFLFTLLNIVFVIILYFAIQNIFFMSFRQRREELATLLTYGMKPLRIQLIGFWESNLLFFSALVLSLPFSWLITFIVQSFAITNSSLGELIAAIGGPRINFSINWITIPALIVFLWAVTVISAYRGANNYLKIEIREITSKI